MRLLTVLQAISYHLFALGLGRDKNEEFTAWVEPYAYSTGGVLGTTVSAPIYNRVKDPHLFLGVMGFDLRMLAVDNTALGAEYGELAENYSPIECQLHNSRTHTL